MASRIDCLNLNEPAKTRTWLLAFSALSRSKGWKDKNGVNGITDNFMALCGLETLEKVQHIISPKYIEDTPFSAIKSAIEDFITKDTNYHS